MFKNSSRTAYETISVSIMKTSQLQVIWCDFDRASSLICVNKMPTRCNRGFYCRSYCLVNMFRASLCPSSGAQEYYTVVAACGIFCAVVFSSSWSGVELRVMCPVCRMQTGRITLSSTPDQLLEKTTAQKIPHAATTVYYSWAPDDGHSDDRNMLSKQ